jgi:hypothetical protein
VKRSIRELNVAYATCMALLLSASLCNEVMATPSSPLPVVKEEAPSVHSEDMWGQYPQFFERFKKVWQTCRTDIDLDEAVRYAKWFNDQPKGYDEMLRTCLVSQGGVASNRSWPPTPKQAKVARPDRFFEWDPVRKQWVQKK